MHEHYRNIQPEVKAWHSVRNVLTNHFSFIYFFTETKKFYQMNAQILPFPTGGPASVASPIAHYLRIGEAHRKLADLHAVGRLPAGRAVFDASRLRHQRELLRALRDNGTEIVLDTEVAELGANAKFRGHCRAAPWAVPDAQETLGPHHFSKSEIKSLARSIASFAVENRIDTVLSPSHYLSDPTYSDWLEIDHKLCLGLREELDVAGGEHISLDYPIIVSDTDLGDSQFRGSVVANVSDLPVNNIWIRASGMGSDVGPLKLKRYLSKTSALHNLGKPIIADYLGELVGCASVAFGTISGFAHGIAERERFDAGSWHKPPVERDEDAKFSRAVRIWLTGANRSATINELKLLERARGGRRLVSCGDKKCCPHGFDDMVGDPRRHAAYQSFNQVLDLEVVPDLRRRQHFLDGHMSTASRTARQLAKLRLSPVDAAALDVDYESLMKRLLAHSMRMEKVQRTLETLHEMLPDEAPRARTVARQVNVDPKKENRK
ncbi:MAG: hypothetical protein ACREHE_08205 [Rhizomicrobium sp.]